MARTKDIKDGLTISQRENQPDIFPARDSISFGMLEEDVQWGLLPLGAVIAVMPHINGSFLPAGGGSMKNGLQLCDGAAIASGASLSGSTPNINGDSYLRGATSTTGTIWSNNERVINTPQIPPHLHPLGTVATDNMPHDHPSSIADAEVPHNHNASTGTSNVPHQHEQSAVGYANMPHSHNAPVSTANAPHSHPSYTGYSNMPHSHSNPGSSGNSSSQAPHGHEQVVGANSGGGWHRDWNNDGSASRFYSGSFNSSTAGAPHTHSISFPSGGPHNHPAGISTNNMPHNHPLGVSSNNAPHSHVTTIVAANAPHVHTGTLSPDSMPHNHTQTLINTSIAHNHNATVNPIGSGDLVNFEPQYVRSVFVMRVK